MNDFTLNDFKRELMWVLRPGIIEEMLRYLPGIQHLKEMSGEDAICEGRRMVGIINSMTPEERNRVSALDSPRRVRIARGAGVTESEVSGLIKQYQLMAIMKRVSLKNKLDLLRSNDSWPESWFDDPDENNGP
jgi:signal recognition particle subunit SRP54